MNIDGNKIVMIALSDIDRDDGKRIRSVNPSYVEVLAVEIEERGQRTPIDVRASKKKGGKPYTLIAGGHRCAAIELNGGTEIAAFIHVMDDDQAALHEIDENLMRHELTYLARAACLDRRQTIYHRLYPTSKSGGVRKGDQIPTNWNLIPTFAVDAAKKIGVSKNTIYDHISIFKSLQPATVKVLENTALADMRGELQYLGKIEPPIEQVALAKKAVAEGKRPSEYAEPVEAPVRV